MDWLSKLGNIFKAAKFVRVPEKRIIEKSRCDDVDIEVRGVVPTLTPFVVADISFTHLVFATGYFDFRLD
jgi:hypothetical protein